MRIGNGMTFLLGGARSGKSDLAVRLGEAWDGDVIVAATAEAGDDDMARRIARHQDDRPNDWGLLEAPLLSAHEVVGVDAGALLIIDCVTMLVTNLIFADKTNAQIDEHMSVLAHALVSRTAPTMVISNEVGLSVHPETDLGRRFQGTLGRANKRIADRAQTTLFIAAGRAVAMEPVEIGW